ncbi:MAG: sugar phosphate isomerase/epimerase [Rhodospirillales bacterium]|nr:sugar phosphate isomerase/epimerase [Rhodospirillales bacterium]
MPTVKGPGLFIAQYIDADARLSTLEGIAVWAAGLGFKGLQIPTWRPHIFDLAKAAESQAYCDALLGLLRSHGLELTELTSQRQGHVLALNPAYDLTAGSFAPEAVRADPVARTRWASDQLMLAARASRRLGLKRHVTFSGSLLWPHFYPYPPLPEGLVEAGFRELAARWRPVLDAFDAAGTDVCYELHPTEDLHDGATFERFLEILGGHPRCNILYDPSHLLLQHMDYVGFVDVYRERIRAFHVKDAEFRKSARTGVYGGYRDWPDRAGRFRSTGDGDVDFRAIFSRLAAIGYDGWACLEWECYLKDRYQGAREGAAFIASHIVPVTPAAFDAPMRPKLSDAQVARALGIDRPAT